LKDEEAMALKGGKRTSNEMTLIIKPPFAWPLRFTEENAH
jgi:hypothetical protein